MGRAITRAPPSLPDRRPPAQDRRRRHPERRVRRPGRGQHLSGRTRLSSLELGCDDSRTVGNCDSALRAPIPTASRGADRRRRCRRDESAPGLRTVRRHRHQRAGGRARARCSLRRSILDLVSARTGELMAELGPSDKRKLDEYLSSIREIERRIERSEKDMTGLTLASTSRPASRCSTPITST